MFPRRVALALFGLAIAGCGGARDGVPVDSAKEIASASTRLVGSWRLERFQPVQPLGPAFDALLAFQVQNLVIRLDGHRLVADSPGLHVDRGYEIREASGDSFKVVVTDEQGVQIFASCNFVSGGGVEAQVMSDPWRGVATLRKTSP